MEERAVKGIVIDAGHGGNDPGAVANGLKEKDLTLKAANYMYDRLKQLGVPTKIVRDTDETLNQTERVKKILDAYGNEPNVIVVSNHINAGGGEGAEIIYALRNNSTLARNILEEIGSKGQLMRKYYQRRLPEDPMKDYYFIHRLTGKTQPILIEYGFIDNKADSKKLQDNLLDYVEAAVKALTEYAGYKYTPPTGSGDYYQVQKGDSLWSISSKLGVSVAELRRLNNLTSDTLQVGQLLKISEKPSGDTETSTYTVQKGDSLWSIANKFGVSIAELKALNNLTTDILQVGQVLKISNEEQKPDKPPILPPTSNETYTVKSGDSLWTVANKYNITVDEIKNANNLTSNLLSIGQVLIIPTKNNPTYPPSNQEIYIVQSGDSLWKIANNFGVSVDNLIKENNLSSNTLSIGQKLVIPKKTKLIYTVVRGDSLWTIANQFATTVDKLKEVNKITSNILNIGQQLIIPN